MTQLTLHPRPRVDGARVRQAAVVVRTATADDQLAIVALVRSEQLNPNGLHWPRFVVAERNGRLIGAAQLRQHPDGARELGSLVVSPEHRGRGIAALMIHALLDGVTDTVYAITGAAHFAHYGRWGFEVVPHQQAPASVRWNWRMGRMLAVVTWLKRLPPKRLTILRRRAI